MRAEPSDEKGGKETLNRFFVASEEELLFFSSIELQEVDIYIFLVLYLMYDKKTSGVFGCFTINIIFSYISSIIIIYSFC